MSVSFQDVVFAFCFERIFSYAGKTYLYDSGPNGFHFTFPTGAADPTRQNDGSFYFDGADYLSYTGDLTRFYAAMPTGEHTWLLASYHDSTGNSQMPFSCYDSGAGGSNDGLVLQRGSTGGLGAWQYQGGATTPVVATTNPTFPTGAKSYGCITVETSPRAMARQKYEAATWAAGAFGTATFNTALAPRIGMHPSGLNPVLGRLYYMALLRGALSSEDLALCSRMLAEGLKPFCWRQT